MAKQDIPQPPGFQQAMQVLSVLSHPEEYAKKLAELETLRQEINEQIRKIGLKGDVDQMMASAKVKNQRAQERLEEATSKSERMLEDAQKEYNQLLNAAQVELEKIKSHSVSLRSELERKDVDLTAREDKLALEKQKLEEDRQRVDAAGAKASELRRTYEAKLKSLEGALNSARGA